MELLRRSTHVEVTEPNYKLAEEDNQDMYEDEDPTFYKYGLCCEPISLLELISRHSIKLRLISYPIDL